MYLRCRTEEEIKTAFEKLMSENHVVIERRMDDARKALMESFDEEVQRKLRTRKERVSGIMDTKQEMVRDVVLSTLPEKSFDYNGTILNLPAGLPGLSEHTRFTFSKAYQDSAELVHAHHPFFANMAASARGPMQVTFDYSTRHNIAAVKDLVGKCGVFGIFKVTVEGLEARDFILPLFLVQEGGMAPTVVSHEIGDKILSVTAGVSDAASPISEELKAALVTEANRNLEVRKSELASLNAELYQEEVQKIESYFEDVREQKRYEIAEIEKHLGVLKKERTKVAFEVQRKLNVEIQRLKDKIEKLESEVTELRKDSRRSEKDRLSELEGKVTLKAEVRLLAEGIFKVV